MNPFRAAGVVVAVLGMVAQIACKPPIIVGYLETDLKQIDGVDLSKYTHINIAFAIPNADGSLKLPDTPPLAEAVKAIHDKKVKALLSVGGWSGSNEFSNIVKDHDKWAKLVADMVSAVKTANLDGIDIDWEYPGRPGNNCNAVDAMLDTPGFQLVLSKLKDAFTAEFGAGKKLITLAVGPIVFGINGKPLTDVSTFAKYVDYAHIMLYDINGAWGDVTGPNAPMESTTGKGAQLSFKSGIEAWIDAKWPPSQLTAGAAFYGHTLVSKVDMSTDPKNQYQPQTKATPKGDSDDAPWEDKCAGTNSLSGIWKWKNLRSQGVLTAPDTAGAGWKRYWDSVSQTPWLFNPTNKNYISYDDPKSLQAKVAYAAQKGLAGMMVWAIHMDSKNELLNALLTWPGKTTCLKPRCQVIDTSSSEDNDTTTEEDTTEDTTADDGTTEDTTADDGTTEDTTTDSPPADGTCTENGKYTCADSGKSSEYRVCNFNRDISMQCSPGTKCFTLGVSIVCAVTNPQA
ncbi:hypothetical protein H4R19_001629 [Coemansia spiralis]|nr:hypothetical protein H4R19_001629 [Coemansia spiralis]